MSEPDDQVMGGDGAANPATVRISSEVMAASAIFLFMVVLFVFLLYLYARRYLRTDHASLRARTRSRFIFAAADLAPAPRRGLDAAVLRSLPVTVYRAVDFKEGLECVVCLSELADGEEVRLLPKCAHGFHLECIDMWFHSHSTCPLCRCPVGAEPFANANPAAETMQTPPSETVPESPIFPTNVSVWGSQEQVSADHSAAVQAGVGSPEVPSTSSGRSSKPEGALVIDIPRRAAEGFLSPVSPLPSSRLAAEETKTPVSAALRSLRRLWSSCSPREDDIEQGLWVCQEGRAPPPKSLANS